MDNDPILIAENLSKSFFEQREIEVLKEVCLTLYPGESLAITGPSGVGKSTLLHVLGTIERPCSGSLQIAGQNALTPDAALIRNRHIGFIFQNFNLLPDYTALENVLMPGKIARKPMKKDSSFIDKAHTLLKQVSLLDRIDCLARHLSGGEKQRVAIARALYNDPDIILADEPSGNLDDKQSSMIHTLLLTLTEQTGKALIIVTHDQALASLCHRKLFLKNARLI
ncbi:MAG: ABC transporter ATP-binding protein [Chlamydiota bacterium]